MSAISRDGVLYKKIILGILAAGAGVTIYYGYIKWKTRQRSGDGDPSSASDQDKATGEKKKDSDTSKASAPDVATDPTPVLKPEQLSRSNSSASGPDSLSVSGTFEKVSLSAFQEHAQSGTASGAASGVQSPTSSFEKVPLATPDLRNLDAPTVTEVIRGGEVTEMVSPAGSRGAGENGRRLGSGASGAQPATGRSRTEMKVDMAAALKPEPATAKNSISIANMPKSPAATQASGAATQAKSTPAGAQSSSTTIQSDEEDEEEDSDEEEESDEEDDETDDSQESQGKNDASTMAATQQEEPTSPFYDLATDAQLFPDNRSPKATEIVQAELRGSSDTSHADHQKNLLSGEASLKSGSVQFTNTVSSQSVTIIDATSKPGPVPQVTKTWSVPEVTKAGTVPTVTKTWSIPEVSSPINVQVIEAQTVTKSSKSVTETVKTENVTQAKITESVTQVNKTGSTMEVSKSGSVTEVKSGSVMEVSKSGSVTEVKSESLIEVNISENLKTNSVQESTKTVEPKPLSNEQSNTISGQSTASEENQGASSISGSQSGSVPSTPTMSSRASSSSSLKDADNVSTTLQRLHRCLDKSSRTSGDGRVVIGHPRQPGKHIDMGMVLSTDTPHIVNSVVDEGLAQDCGISVGESLMTVNNMAVDRWQLDVLLQFFAHISGSEFEMTLSPADEPSKAKGMIRHITVNLTSHENIVKVKPIIVEKTSANQLAPPVELGTFTPKACFIQKPESGHFMVASGHGINVADRAGDHGPFEMMRLLFTRANTKGYQVPVTMLAFCHDDVISYICAVDRHTLALMHQKDLDTGVDLLKVADCRFFNHRFIAGYDCFEATQLPDHYLSYDGRQVKLTYISSPELVGQEKTAHFKVKYTTGK